MKTYQAVALGLALLAAAPANSQDGPGIATTGVTPPQRERYQKLDMDKVEATYLNCLNSTNNGVVESAVGIVTYIRVIFPERKMCEIRSRLFDLATHGATFSIRAKAYMAMQVFADPVAFRSLADSNRANADWPFDNIAAKYRP